MRLRLTHAYVRLRRGKRARADRKGRLKLLMEEFPHNLAGSGDERDYDIERLQFEGEQFEIHAAQMFVAGQEHRAAQQSGFGEDKLVMYFGLSSNSSRAS